MSQGFLNPSGLYSTVPQGGTGVVSLTAFELLAAGTTPTGPVQQVPAGTTGALLASAGAGALPQFSFVPGTIAVQDASAVDITGGAAAFTGPVFTSAATVAALPVGAEGQLAYASDGRKVGEGPGAGTGVPVYFSAGSWRVFSTDLAVAA